MHCRHCHSDHWVDFINLGTSPPSNAYLSSEELGLPETWFPLNVKACFNCFLVQTEILEDDLGLFPADYAYFSSFSDTMLAHSKKFVSDISDDLSLDKSSRVIEIASNDGYLLQYFQEIDIPCIGIEPTRDTAQVARSKGIEVIEDFFGTSLAQKMSIRDLTGDLIIANNVLAHVPNINDFLSGVRTLLKEKGVATFEFPYLINLVKFNQFDTIYHEHFFYFSLHSVVNIFESNGLFIYDVHEIDIHGGSLRVFARQVDNNKIFCSKRVSEMLQKEKDLGVTRPSYYEGFTMKADKVKHEIYDFLIQCKLSESVIIGYGAAAKGNTLLNYAGITEDLIRFIVDKNPAKQNKFLPGSNIPIFSEDMIKETKPDYILILPWNLKEEIMKNLNYVKEWGCKFVIAIPKLEIYD